jgi:hypothetical protein
VDTGFNKHGWKRNGDMLEVLAIPEKANQATNERQLDQLASYFSFLEQQL